MLREIYQKICAGQDVRANLIELKLQLKSPKNREELKKICNNNFDPVMRLLVHEDAKVRKNVAAMLGLLKIQDAADVLMDAYLEEDKLFVRPEYLNALAQLDCTEYLEEFHERLDALSAYDAPENEKKHVQEEIHALQNLILSKEGLKQHTFTGYENPNEVILTTIPAFRDVLAGEITSKKVLLRAGVKTIPNNLHDLMNIRIWNEILFVLNCKKIKPEACAIADALATSNLMEILTRNHTGEAPFYYRISVTGDMSVQERSDFTKRVVSAIGDVCGSELVNNASHYEMEIRLMPDKEGLITPYLKLFTIPDRRFQYRQQHVAASMKPFMAAGMLALARPFLKEYAQVLDPFCGVGTLLIERRFAGTVRTSYGIDTFGEAIEKARINTRYAGLQINYINRNYFDFEHEYLFDEIITDMPAQTADKTELDWLYRRFFEKSAEVLNAGGRIFCYSREMGLIKKYLRLEKRFRLLKEFLIMEKSGMHLYVIEMQ